MGAAETQQWRGLSPYAAERVASTILLHCLIHKPHRELKNLGDMRSPSGNRAPPAHSISAGPLVCE